MIEYQPLSPLEIEALRLKAMRGELTPEDTRRFIESTRAAFLARPAAAAGKKKAPKVSKVAAASTDGFTEFF